MSNNPVLEVRLSGFSVGCEFSPRNVLLRCDARTDKSLAVYSEQTSEEQLKLVKERDTLDDNPRESDWYIF